MKSQRIDGKGKETMAPYFPSDDYQSSDWEAWCMSRFGTPQQQYSAVWPHPANTEVDNDSGFTPVNRRSTWPDGSDYSGSHVPEDYDKYLASVAQFNVGDFVCFKWHSNNNAHMTATSVRCILFQMPRSELTWPKGQGLPKPFIVANCAGVNNPPQNCYVSYEDMHDMRLLTAEEYDKFVTPNVQLQDYIQQVKDAIKAGKCIVGG